MLHIVHINDTEAGTYDNWPRIATAIRDLRAAGRCDLLLHAGDVSLATPHADAAVRIMNRLAFDAVVPGNHEFDLGTPALRLQLTALHAPALCANVSGPAADCLQPYRLLRRQGVRIALCGVTLPSMALLQPERHLAGLAFDPPDAALIDLVPRLQREAELVVVLSHCGYEADRELARIRGIDLIIGGHSHDLLPHPVRVGDAWVAQAGEEGAHVGWLEARQIDGQVMASGGLIPTARLLPDPDALTMTPVPAEDEAAILGYTTTDLRTPNDTRETPLGNLTVDLLRAYADTDVALLRCCSVVNSLPAGPIRRRDMVRLNATGLDRVARLEASGEELRAVLECGAQEAYYLLTISGARVVFDASRPPGQRLAAAEIGGAPLDHRRRYRVACLEILARGASIFMPFRGKAYELLPQTLNELLARHIHEVGAIRPALDGRLTIHGRLPGCPGSTA